MIFDQLGVREKIGRPSSKRDGLADSCKLASKGCLGIARGDWAVELAEQISLVVHSHKTPSSPAELERRA
eukprot:676845-Pyramimonas_sp.AAC.1